MIESVGTKKPKVERVGARCLRLYKREEEKLSEDNKTTSPVELETSPEILETIESTQSTDSSKHQDIINQNKESSEVSEGRIEPRRSKRLKNKK